MLHFGGHIGGCRQTDDDVDRSPLWARLGKWLAFAVIICLAGQNARGCLICYCGAWQWRSAPSVARVCLASALPAPCCKRSRGASAWPCAEHAVRAGCSGFARPHHSGGDRTRWPRSLSEGRACVTSTLVGAVACAGLPLISPAV